MKILKYTTIILSLMLLFSCSVKDGSIATEVDLPLDTKLNLYSIDEGIHPDTSILDDENNPYRRAGISMDSVWNYYEDCPSAKSKFYLWATMVAKYPMGEYQYYTARSLHELYTVSGSEVVKEQAKKAYKACLDHFFNSVTWYEAWWLGDDTVYAVLIKDLVGQALYNPSEINFASFYNDPVQALADLSEWGYIYNIETKSVSKRQ